MANLIDRLIYETESDADVTEGIIDLTQFQAALALYDAGTVNAQFIKDTFGMTSEQAAELDEVLATRPDPATGDPVARATWVQRVMAPLVAGYAVGGTGWTGFEHPPEIRAALGLPVV